MHLTIMHDNRRAPASAGARFARNGVVRNKPRVNERLVKIFRSRKSARQTDANASILPIGFVGVALRKIIVIVSQDGSKIGGGNITAIPLYRS